MYWPLKYYRGLTRKQNLQRKRSATRRTKMSWKDPKAYVGFATDKIPTRRKKSSYTVQWQKLYPKAKSLKQRAAVTGVPLGILDAVFRRGSAAWRTGHRPGQTTQSWSYPRVSSFLLCGKTHYTADSDLVRRARRTAKGRKWFRRCVGTLPATGGRFPRAPSLMKRKWICLSYREGCMSAFTPWERGVFVEHTLASPQGT